MSPAQFKTGLPSRHGDGIIAHPRGGASKDMPVSLMSKWLQRVATVLVVLYGFCLVAPVAALAFGDYSASAHCFSDDHHEIGNHIHHGNAGQQGGQYEPASGDPASVDDDRAYSKECCGLFNAGFTPPCFGIVASPLAHASTIVTANGKSLLGHGSERIDRPPRFLLSL